MLKRIWDVCFHAKEVLYHRICRTRYQRKADRAHQKDMQALGLNEETKSDWQHLRETHSAAFDVLCEFVDE